MFDIFVTTITNITSVMKKMLEYSKGLNGKIRMEAMRRGVSANALIVEVLEGEFGNGIPDSIVVFSDDAPTLVPLPENGVGVTVDGTNPLKGDIVPVKKGMVSIEDKEGDFVSRASFVDGITTNGICYRVGEGDLARYFYALESAESFAK